MAKASTLVVWANGVRVATWIAHDRGAHALQYDSAWPESPARRPLSLSLAFTPGNVPHRGATVANFFDNLLPDSDAIRSRIRSQFGTESTGTFDLLTAIGRDCVGAVQLLPEGEEPLGFDRIRAKPLTDEEVDQAIAANLSDARAFGQREATGF